VALIGIAKFLCFFDIQVNRYTMAATLDLPLPEITVEDFGCAWTRFELVVKAKEWDAARQNLVLPTLLRGKLVQFYIEASDEFRAVENLFVGKGRASAGPPSIKPVVYGAVSEPR